MPSPFPLPPVPASPSAVNDSGWNDELTQFHENFAGERHYIDIASRRNSLAQLRKWVKAERPSIMDIGCSSGFLLGKIRQAFPHGRVVGADYVSAPLRKLAADHPDWPLIQFDLTASPLPDACLDAVSLANVLEHIGDDVAAAREVFRMLRPGGAAVIEVPAGPDLFDIYDKQLLHFRRYSRQSLHKLLADSGFDVHDESYIGCLIYPAFALVKKRNKRYLALPDEEQLKIVEDSIKLARGNPVMNAIMSFEETLRYRIPLPFGIRCVAVGRKPTSAS